MNSKNTPEKRRYRMGARAEAVGATGRRILESAIGEFGARTYDEVTLADVAAAAGVTVQTVLRRFGSKEGLVEAAGESGAEEVRRTRWSAPAGDVDAAMRDLAEHYEAWGDRSLHFLAQEARVGAMKRVVEAGRALHHEWVDHVFEPWIRAAEGGVRRSLRARLIAATDVYVWKILRRDLGLGPRVAAGAMRDLVRDILD